MNDEFVLKVYFYQSEAGNEPVREWLKSLDKVDMKVIGEDIKTVQLRWPLGMPLIRKLEAGLWEVRSHLTGKRIARVLFTVHDDEMVLLHGFEKDSKKTPKADLELARKRRKAL
ncbi:MAG: type II toxin-antitoxin system RelE/ParE family toxin [Gammaproteobacteria bacterium]|nr:MAG: type II toxin-antitoxin system RelE/ParE family toxin [Gammaproteobacteria bacterium]